MYTVEQIKDRARECRFYPGTGSPWSLPGFMHVQQGLQILCVYNEAQDTYGWLMNAQPVSESVVRFALMD